VGFSKANNQAIRISKGEYVLLLNPDTVVEADTFDKIIAFMDEHPNAGGLGVKMLDGQGKFLPESKRGLPTPATAFYKIFGLSALFPHSKKFARYHLGYLDNDQTNEVEILAGAFMLMRKSVLDEIGLLDEAFFMYGEDIDLSYRITLAGFKNYYYPQTRIIHYKGESTKKSSVNYVFVFYNAMIIFARKHFSQKRAKTFTFLINIAIYFRAFLAISARFIRKITLPLFDALLAYFGFLFIKTYWGGITIYSEGGDYPYLLVVVVIPAYVGLWLISIFLSGGYDKPIKLAKAIRGIIIGTVFILVLYGLLPETYRFSRALIFLGAVWFAAIASLLRITGHLIKLDGFVFGKQEKKRFLVIGSNDEAQRVKSILKSTAIVADFIGLVSTNQDVTADNDYIGNIDQVPDIITIYKINEVIFCSKDLSHQTIINKMTEWDHTQINYKIAPEDSLSIIGSNSINTRGDLYTIDIKAIDTIGNRRNKRLFDILSSAIVVVTWPILLFFVPKPLGALSNAIRVFFGRRSMIGFCKNIDNQELKLPHLRKGVLSPADVFQSHVSDPEVINRLNLLYARDYTIYKDINIFSKSFQKIGVK
ncbi:MAG: glycosyltransferase family 2 protein, partial [Ignavibacteria bacterium]|nr:glycosyltransferase family 2 protein [Ignavibacteria bacterium]